MSHHLSSTFKRIMSIQWAGNYDRVPSRLALMREYLRRAAWWADALKATPWPFFDIAYAIKQDVRANPNLVAQVEARLNSELGLTKSLVVQTCERALHFAALLDSGTPLPRLPDSVQQPFEPLLVMFERGDGFRIEGGGLIEIDSIGMQRGTIQSNHTNEPIVSLKRSELDALDAARKF